LWQTSAQSIWSGQPARSPRRAGPTRSLATGCAQRAALEEVADLLSKVFSDSAFFESQNLCFDKHRPHCVFFHPAAPPWEIKHLGAQLQILPLQALDIGLERLSLQVVLLLELAVARFHVRFFSVRHFAHFRQHERISRHTMF